MVYITKSIRVQEFLTYLKNQDIETELQKQIEIQIHNFHFRNIKDSAFIDKFNKNLQRIESSKLSYKYTYVLYKDKKEIKSFMFREELIKFISEKFSYEFDNEKIKKLHMRFGHINPKVREKNLVLFNGIEIKRKLN